MKVISSMSTSPNENAIGCLKSGYDRNHDRNLPDKGAGRSNKVISNQTMGASLLYGGGRLNKQITVC